MSVIHFCKWIFHKNEEKSKYRARIDKENAASPFAKAWEEMDRAPLVNRKN